MRVPRDGAGQHDGDGGRIRVGRVGQPGKSDAVSGRGLSERYGEAYKAGARLRVGEFFALDAEAARVERNGVTPALYRAALLANLRW